VDICRDSQLLDVSRLDETSQSVRPSEDLRYFLFDLVGPRKVIGDVNPGLADKAVSHDEEDGVVVNVALSGWFDRDPRQDLPW
jgi:hypothetical protein